MLIAAGAKLSPMTLHRAASGGLLGIVQALVSAGADVRRTAQTTACRCRALAFYISRCARRKIRGDQASR